MSVIARIWRGHGVAGNAEDYRQHVTEDVFPALSRIAGYAGAYLLERPVGGNIEFLAVTLWDSIEAVKQFAGGGPDVAVVEPEARALLADFDEFAHHYEVYLQTGCRTFAHER
jgi:heme-degrading monooxygenase HmoA